MKDIPCTRGEMSVFSKNYPMYYTKLLHIFADLDRGYHILAYLPFADRTQRLTIVRTIDYFEFQANKNA